VSPTRTFAVVLVGAALVCGALAFRTDDPAPAREPNTHTLATPLWSVRRVPQPIVDAVGAQRLQHTLDGALDAIPGCFLVEEGTAPIASRDIDAPVTPASTQKLLTTAVALATLGPDSRLETRAVAQSAPSGGAIARLWLVGGGDPLLTTPDVELQREQNPELRGTPTTPLSTLADSIVAAGVKRIPGGIVGDDSRYEALRYLPTWKSSYRTDGQVGPIGALTVNSGFSVLKPKPVPVDDPATYAAAQLQRLLEAKGVSVGQAASHGKAPDGAVEIAKLQSPPLHDVVSEILDTSDNLGAEMLAREIGLHQAQQGTTVAGTKAIAAKLAELGLPTASLNLVDGSGLDRGDRVTCRLLARTLDLGAQPQFSALWSGLPVAGQSGTLVAEFRGTPLQGRARAKTGTLDGVTALVGFIDVGHPLRFAFVANGTFAEKAALDLRDRFASIAGTFPDAPNADALVPAPAAASGAS
jgi:D-alanyl-D-alanine carboxypeptidase/D-alanyl-D-alanine-endopeptidase (penicillin-binding protein 4)